jgi:carbon monoxide dehydrogenase subunit G
LTRRAAVRVDRDADWVFRELHDPRALISCVPGACITKIFDARRFEARVVAGVGPFQLAYAGTGCVTHSDPRSRTASLTIAGAGLGMPPTRVRMAMVVSPCLRGAELRMSFRLTLASSFVRGKLLDSLVSDLLERTVHRMKVQLESRPAPPFDSAALSG